ncbi:hypothetical protein EV424DRAFT_325694 [Suillus variegatus]|nr:hypothetical protein EV424DRAFT_325694 [Suillus variegatus]
MSSSRLTPPYQQPSRNTLMQRQREFRDLLTVVSASSSMLGISQRARLELEHFISPDNDNVLQVFASMLSGVSRGPYNQWRKCFEFFEISLSWPDRDFRHEYRVGRPTFDRLVHLLEQNPIFRSTGKRPQRAVRYQLACFLLRYGTRVRALRELGIHVVSWGDDERRQETSEYIMDAYGFPDCVGMLDGTLIRLTQMPEENGFTFICRKKFPAVSYQIHMCRA